MKYLMNRSEATCTVPLNDIQEKARVEMLSRINNGEYRLRENPCLCGNRDRGNDMDILNFDRYGTPVRMVLCKCCSLLRTDPVLDDSSLVSFYTNDFSLLHRGTRTPNPQYLSYVFPVGEKLFEWIGSRVEISRLRDVLEIGCATGANLLPFHRAGLNTVGYDFDAAYLDHGRSLGLNLIEGFWEKEVKGESQDLIILMHVLEHMTTPLQDLYRVVKLLRPGGLAYIEVPGVFSIIERWKHCPSRYFQHDHIFHYHRKYLVEMVKQMGVRVVHCDGWCRLLIERPTDWRVEMPDSLSFYGPCMSPYVVSLYLRFSYCRFFVRSAIVSFFRKVGLKPFLTVIRSKLR